MNTLATTPALDELYDFIRQIRAYPISVDRLISMAKDINAPRTIIDFYKSFGQNQTFQNKDDLINRSEQVDILRQEEADMPPDILTIVDED